ncbi:MAG: hypothetical protein ACRDDX_08325 [Cellulosilyticaceae bacterium]
MIHTIQLYTALTLDQVKTIEEAYKLDIKEITKQVEVNYEGVVINFFSSNLNHTYFISLFIDAVKLLGTADIRATDCIYIQKVIDAITDDLQLPTECLFNLTRIDYRLDIAIKNKTEREFMFKLYNKLFTKYRFLKMCNRKKINKSSGVTTTEPFKSTVYFSSKSVTVTVYDKEKEREAKSEAPEDYEKDILRFELRLNNKHLNYKKKKGIPKTLQFYMNEKTYEEYMQHYLYSIFGKDDYYNLREARKIMEQKLVKEKDKKEIEAFLIRVSKSSLEGVRKDYSHYKIKKILNLLNDLEINPILIPINAGMPGRIRNPLR